MTYVNKLTIDSFPVLLVEVSAGLEHKLPDSKSRLIYSYLFNRQLAMQTRLISVLLPLSLCSLSSLSVNSNCV